MKKAMKKEEDNNAYVLEWIDTILKKHNTEDYVKNKKAIEEEILDGLKKLINKDQLPFYILSINIFLLRAGEYNDPQAKKRAFEAFKCHFSASFPHLFFRSIPPGVASYP